MQSTRTRGCQACGRALVPNQLAGIEYESCAAAQCIAHQFLEPRDAEDSASHIVEGEIDDSTLPQGATGEAPQIRRRQSRGNSQPLASAQQLHRNRPAFANLSAVVNVNLPLLWSVLGFRFVRAGMSPCKVALIVL